MVKTTPTRSMNIAPVSGFCPGCGHGIVNRIIAELFDEMDIGDKAICANAVGCSCINTMMTSMDLIQAPHGRAGAVATGLKRARPNSFVFTYQGDGDFAAIGLSESLYTAQRNENVTTICINNGVFGMTGGQMSPTTLEGQRTATSKSGRDVKKHGAPLRIAELVAQFDHVAYVTRTSLHNPQAIAKTKAALKKAFQIQLDGKGYSCIEIMAPCPTNWGMSSLDAIQRMETEVLEYYKLGDLVDNT